MSLEMARESRDILDGENHWRQSREQDWYAIKALHTNRACRVPTVSFCKARGEEGEHSSPMRREAGENIGGVSVDAPDNPHVLS